MSKGSEYMEWAKTRSQATYNLALSGVIAYPLAELGVEIADLEITGDSLYGYAPLLEALAAKSRVTPDCVVHTIGTSMANHLAMATILERGDEVLIEHPAYDPLLSVPRYLGAEIRRFYRRFEDGFRIDIDEIKRAITARTKLIILTNFHNPSGVLTDNQTLRQVGEIARSVGARVLVDEVYLEAMYEQAQDSAFHLGSEFIITSSLTKAYGLSGLRCGWILAEPELARKMWRLNDLYGAVHSHPAELLSVIALSKLPEISARAKSLLQPNRQLLNDFLASRSDIEAALTEYGTTSFPRLLTGSVAELCVLLRNKYDTSVVPGRFFEMENHFRIGICCEPEQFAAGLERLSAALDELSQQK